MKLSRTSIAALLVALVAVSGGCTLVNRVRAKNALNEGARAYKDGRFPDAEEKFRTAYELDLVCASFTYNGAEGFWTQPDMSWMVQASHESSITFGGEWLLQAMKAALPEFDRYIYRGWDDTLYA